MKVNFLTEIDATLCLKRARKKRLRRSVVKYLIDHGASSLSEIIYGITVCYVIKVIDNYYINFHVSRREMKSIIKSLISDGYIEFISGHKWKISELGFHIMKRDDWL